MDKATRKTITDRVFDMTIGCGEEPPVARVLARLEKELAPVIGRPLDEDERALARREHAACIQSMQQP